MKLVLIHQPSINSAICWVFFSTKHLLVPFRHGDTVTSFTQKDGSSLYERLLTNTNTSMLHDGK